MAKREEPEPKTPSEPTQLPRLFHEIPGFWALTEAERRAIHRMMIARAAERDARRRRAKPQAREEILPKPTLDSALVAEAVFDLPFEVEPAQPTVPRASPNARADISGGTAFSGMVVAPAYESASERRAPITPETHKGAVG